MPCALIGGIRLADIPLARRRALVASATEVRDPFLLDGPNRVSNYAALKPGRVGRYDILADHLTAVGGEREYSVGERRIASGVAVLEVGRTALLGAEIEARARGDVMHDLHHRAAFVVAAVDR